MIKVGYLVSYDYELIFNSLPTIYNDADSIYLAIDENRSTWSGNNFTIKILTLFKYWLYDSKIKELIVKSRSYLATASRGRHRGNWPGPPCEPIISTGPQRRRRRFPIRNQKA